MAAGRQLETLLYLPELNQFDRFDRWTAVVVQSFLLPGRLETDGVPSAEEEIFVSIR